MRPRKRSFATELVRTRSCWRGATPSFTSPAAMCVKARWRWPSPAPSRADPAECAALSGGREVPEAAGRGGSSSIRHVSARGARRGGEPRGRVGGVTPARGEPRVDWQAVHDRGAHHVALRVRATADPRTCFRLIPAKEVELSLPCVGRPLLYPEEDSCAFAHANRSTCPPRS